MIGRNDEVFSLRTTTANSEDTLTRLPRTDFGTNLIHFACEFQSGNISRSSRRRRIVSFTLQNIGAI
jgi:hypothetical protein